MADIYTFEMDEFDGEYEVHCNGELWWSVTDKKSGEELCAKLNVLELEVKTLQAENARLKALLNKRDKWSEADFIDTLEDFFSLCERCIGQGFSDDDLLFAREEYKRFLDIEKQVSTLKRNCQNLIRDNNALKGKD